MCFKIFTPKKQPQLDQINSTKKGKGILKKSGKIKRINLINFNIFWGFNYDGYSETKKKSSIKNVTFNVPIKMCKGMVRF